VKQKSDFPLSGQLIFPLHFGIYVFVFQKKKKEKKLNGRSLTTFKGGKSFD